MFKLLTLACVFLALSSVHSQTCQDTMNLRTLYGFANTVTSPTAASGVNYCKSIKNSNVCCTASDINSIPEKSAKMVANLTAMVSARDVYIKTIKDTVIPNMVTSFQTLTPIAAQFETYVTVANLTGVSGFDAILDALDSIFEVSAYLVANLTAIKNDYVGYQTARSSCVVEMVSLQNAAYCLACDPNAGSKGFSYQYGYNIFDMSADLCTRLKSSCSDYIEGAIGQNALIAASYGTAVVNVLGTVLQGLMTGDLAAVQTLMTAMGGSNGPESAYVSPVGTPEGCDGGSCEWICDSLFDAGELDQLALISGGNNDFFGRRRLSENNKRMLSGSWSPDKDESGVTVTFAADPANTNSKGKSASVIGNVFVSMMVVISTILLL